MADRIPQHVLDISPNLDDETTAFNFLYMLDSFMIGVFYEQLISVAYIEANEMAIAERDR